jgi:AcrR family transcriptional regulator
MAKSGTKSTLRQGGVEGSGDTRRALVEAAVETLKVDGFAGASARAIAGRAGCNQGLVFYHFGSVVNLLLAALDQVSAERLDHYGESVGQVGSVGGLIDVAAAIFEEDLDAGHVAVLVEMIAGASSTPGLGPEVARRIAPWTDFAEQAVSDSLEGSPLASVIPSRDVAFGIVALYIGLEMLSHLDGDRAPALALFDHARQLAALFDGLGLMPGSAPQGSAPGGPAPGGRRRPDPVEPDPALDRAVDPAEVTR